MVHGKSRSCMEQFNQIYVEFGGPRVLHYQYGTRFNSLTPGSGDVDEHTVDPVTMSTEGMSRVQQFSYQYFSEVFLVVHMWCIEHGFSRFYHQSRLIFNYENLT